MTDSQFAIETIVAPSTPPGQSGLAVIRLSGPDAVTLTDRFFRPKRSHKRAAAMAGYTMSPGDFADIDEVVVAVFLAPHSFTGEDVVEITCHGGSAVKRAILAALLEAGAVIAEPGEFSRRAFMNGKIDLVQAEAIMDLIGSEAKRQAASAYGQLKGRLSAEFKEASASLYRAMASVELMLEFPEHEMHAEAMAELSGQVRSLGRMLEHLSQTYRRGRLIHDGARVVIYGEPNVGKSSLLNAFIGMNRAIVTDIPGTTRDTIEHHLELGGYKVIIVDTAGVRETDDVIEREGVRRSEEAVAGADIILALFTDRPTEADLAALRALQAEDKGIVLILSKDDLLDTPGRQARMETTLAMLKQALPAASVISYSAYRADDQALLAGAIAARLDETDKAGASDLLVTNVRHKQVLDDVAAELAEAASEISAGLTFDLVAVRLRHAADRLAELTGDDVSEMLVDTIFSSFCVGK